MRTLKLHINCYNSGENDNVLSLDPSVFTVI